MDGLQDMGMPTVIWEFHPKPQTKPVPSHVIVGANNDGLNGKYLTLEGKTSELIKILKPGQRMEQLYEQVHGKGGRLPGSEEREKLDSGEARCGLHAAINN